MGDSNNTQIHCATPNNNTLPRKAYPWKLPMPPLLVLALIATAFLPGTDAGSTPSTSIDEVHVSADASEATLACPPG